MALISVKPARARLGETEIELFKAVVYTTGCYENVGDAAEDPSDELF